MLVQFRHLYPQGSLISELVTIDRSDYIVRVKVKVEGKTLSTGLAAADRIELAEDRARERALAILFLDQTPSSATSIKPQIQPQVEPSVAIAPIKSKPKTDNSKATEAKNSEQVSSVETTSERSNKPISSPRLETTDNLQINHEKVDNHSVSLSDITETIETPTPTASLFDTNFSNQESARIESSDQVIAQSEQIEYSSNEKVVDLAVDDKSDRDTSLLVEENQDSAIASQHPNSDSQVIEITFNEIIDQTDQEMKRLGWTKEIGKEFLKAHYGKKSRLHLNDEELLDFLQYLKGVPTPT